eukprot:scaffold1590_cov417-Prasinococcus_capsulatus_cf.AAC.3
MQRRRASRARGDADAYTGRGAEAAHMTQGLEMSAAECRIPRGSAQRSACCMPLRFEYMSRMDGGDASPIFIMLASVAPAPPVRTTSIALSSSRELAVQNAVLVHIAAAAHRRQNEHGIV